MLTDWGRRRTFFGWQFGSFTHTLPRRGQISHSDVDLQHSLVSIPKRQFHSSRQLPVTPQSARCDVLSGIGFSMFLRKSGGFKGRFKELFENAPHNGAQRGAVFKPFSQWRPMWGCFRIVLAVGHLKKVIWDFMGQIQWSGRILV